MPSLRGGRETRAAIAVTFSRPVPRAGRAPGEPGQDPQPRHRGLTARTPRNGLPEPAGYVYRGTGHDMTGDCQCGTPCPWDGRDRQPPYRNLTDSELNSRIATGTRGQREGSRRELRRRQAARRDILARRAG
jgi:hypothetical protein